MKMASKFRKLSNLVSKSCCNHKSAFVWRRNLSWTRRCWSPTGSADIGFLTKSKENKPKWNRAINEAEKLVGYPNIFRNLKGLPGDDVFSLFTEIRKLLGTNHPLLKIAKRLIYNGRNNMQVRGLIVLLMAKIAEIPTFGVTFEEINEITHKHQEVAEIAEMIHTARFVHKSVVNLKSLENCDHDDLKDNEYGNKVAILVGDYLLATASYRLSNLRNLQTLDLIALAIKNFAEGEFVFEQDKHGQHYPSKSSSFHQWQKKSFLCSGSLLANACRSVLILSNHDNDLQSQAYELGKQLSFAWQIYADIQTFTDESLYPPASSFDLCSLPVILHIENDPTLLATIVDHVNDFDSLDYKKMRAIVKSGEGVRVALDHAVKYTEGTLKILEYFSDSPARIALKNIIKATVFENNNK